MDKDNAGQQQQNQPTTAEQEAAAAEAKRLDELQDEFLNTGRIGRRNAMHDILDEHCETSTAELPLKLSALTTSGEKEEMCLCLFLITLLSHAFHTFRLIVNVVVDLS